MLVVDDKPLRRAQLTAFIAGWRVAMRLDVVESDSIDSLDLVGHDCRLIICRLGRVSHAPAQVARVLRVLTSMYHRTPVVVIADGNDAASVHLAIETGCRGYLPSSFEPDCALAAMSFIMAGGSYFPPEALWVAQVPPEPHAGRVTKLVIPSKREDLPSPLSRSDAGRPDGGEQSVRLSPLAAASVDLTSRQMEVLACLRSGLSNKEIARCLAMSEATAKVHVRQIIRKLGVRNRTQAALWTEAKTRSWARKHLGGGVAS